MRMTVLCVVLTLLAVSSQARTWRVNTTGTGDAPTLYAAMDSAIAGDVVIAEAGQYSLEIETLRVPPDVALVGEGGPSQTLLIQTNFLGPSYTLSLGRDARLESIHVQSARIALSTTGRANVTNCIIEGRVEVLECSFFGSLFVGDILYTSASYFHASIVASYLKGGLLPPTLFACDVVGGYDPDVDVSSSTLSFSLDPQFCGVSGSGNYYLMSTSPCLPANNPFGVPIMIGPMPQGCSTVSVQERTWGGIKAMYMDRR